ncbi:unnamed protein product, partial [Closterium sp. Naga37s-1]
DLNNNALTGSIPPTISHLTRLLHLDPSYNQLSGSIPTAIDGLLSITELNFRLRGSIPAVIGNVTTLCALSLSLPLFPSLVTSHHLHPTPSSNRILSCFPLSHLTSLIPSAHVAFNVNPLSFS